MNECEGTRSVQPAQPADDLYGDDVRPGTRTELGTYSLTAEDIVTFADQWDPQFFHVDEDRAAKEGHFGGLIASGVHTLAIYQRLWVQSREGHWHVIGGAGIRDLQFRRPVRPGDTLTGRTVVENVRFEPDRGRALVDYSGELTNQDGQRVLAVTMSAYLRMRPT